MKKTLLALATLTLFGQAFAGDMDISPVAAPQKPQASTEKPATKMTVQAPVVQVNPAVPNLPLGKRDTASAESSNAKAAQKPAAEPVAPATAAPVVATPTTMNPFTGTSLGAEAIQRELEHSKAATQLLEEQLKQANIIADLANVPVKKRAEVASLKGAELPTPPVVQKPVVKVAPKVVKHPKVKPVAKPSVELAPTTTTAPVVAPSIALEGVIVNDGTAAAVLTVNGNTAIVANGERTPYGVLQVTSEGSASIGGRAYTVHENTIARVKISDPKPVDPKAPVVQVAPQVTPLPQPVPGSNGKPVNLPPIPLPPVR